MSSSTPYTQVQVPTHRLRFLVEYGSGLAALSRKIMKEKETKKNSTIDGTTIVDNIKRLKEELKTAKQSLVPASYTLDKRGGDKVIQKFEGIVKDLIEIDHQNEVFYKELLEELYEMKDDRRPTVDPQKQASGGLSSSSSQVLPFDYCDCNQFEKVGEELSLTTRDRLLHCILFAKKYTCDKYGLFIPQNVEIISKGLLINWLIGLQIVDDPSEGEQFLAELVAESSFNLMHAYSNSKIIISPGFVSGLASLQLDSNRIESKYSGSALLINVNSTCKLTPDQVIEIPIVGDDKTYYGIVHLGNFNRGLEHVVVEDTFASKFKQLMEKEKQIKFLSLQGISRVQELPHSVCDLSELRVLDLRSCQDLKSLPNGIGRLIKLVCLDLSQCYQLDYIPMGIAYLKNLRVLLGFIVVNDKQQQPKDPNHHFAEFKDLKQLTRLIKLTIRTRRMMFPTNEDLQTLNSMPELRKLKVAWVKSFVAESSTDSNIFDYTEGLPKNLEKLELQAAPEATASRLLGLISKRSRNSSLTKIYIRGGNLQKLFSNQHCFPHVKILRLRYLPQLHMNWHDFQLSFPNLSYLQIAECPNLNFFPCDDNGEWIQSDSSL